MERVWGCDVALMDGYVLTVHALSMTERVEMGLAGSLRALYFQKRQKLEETFRPDLSSSLDF